MDEIERRYYGNPFAGYVAQGPQETIDWTFGPKPYERELSLSFRMGPTGLGTVEVFVGIPVHPSMEPDSNDNEGWRWESIGQIENTEVTINPTVSKGWASFRFTIPPYAKGVRLSSNMTWGVGDDLRGLTMTLLPVIRRSV